MAKIRLVTNWVDELKRLVPTDPLVGARAAREQVLNAIGSDSTVLLDVRADDEWTGDNKRGGPRGGRIPGAVHLEWVNFHTGGDVPILRPADEIRKLLADVGVTPDKNIITY